MKKNTLKKTSSFQLRLLTLGLLSVMLGGLVVAGCGGGEEAEMENTTAPASTAEEVE